MHSFYKKQKACSAAEVLLIEPPSPCRKKVLRILGSIGTYKTDMAWPPLDLMIIDGLLSKEGIRSFIFDANSTGADWKDVEEMVRVVKPRMVVFTTSTTTILHDLDTAKVTKAVFPSALTAAIGTHVMALPEKTLKSAPELDAAVFNEAELVVLDLAKNDFDCANTPGVAYRKNGDVLRNSPHPNPENLDYLGFPSHHKMPLSLYHDPLTERLPMTLTYGGRGCINACIYCCSPFYAPLRLRSVEKLIAEFNRISSLGIKEIRFFDPGLTNNLVWAERLFAEMIRNKIDLTWSCESRVDRINPRLVKLMKEAGCRSIDIGVETGNADIMKNIKKNITLEQVETAVNTIKKAGLKVMAHFMLGLPGEAKKTVDETIRFALKLNPDFMAMGIATPHPGTPFYDFLKNNGCLKTDDWSKYDPMARPVFDYPRISGDKLYRSMHRAYRKFYLRPQYIINRLKKIESLEDLNRELRNLRGFASRFLF